MIKPINDWVLIQLDEDSRMLRDLFLPHGNRVRTGTILAVGPGRQYTNEFVAMDAKPGEKIAFFRETLEHKQGKQILQTLDDGTALIRETDILLVLDPSNIPEMSA